MKILQLRDIQLRTTFGGPPRGSGSPPRCGRCSGPRVRRSKPSVFRCSDKGSSSEGSSGVEFTRFAEIQIAEPCAREDARYLEQSERGDRDARVSIRKRRPIRTM